MVYTKKLEFIVYAAHEKNILNFLTFLQDEIHRFVITYHRQLRDSVKLKNGKVYKNVEKKK